MAPRKTARAERVVGSLLLALFLGLVALAAGGYLVSKALEAKRAIASQTTETKLEIDPCKGRLRLAGFGGTDCVAVKHLPPMRFR